MTTEPTFDPDRPPPFRLPKILKARDRAFPLLEGLAGSTPEGEGFDRLRAGLSAVLKRAPDDPVVFETARSLPRRPFARRDLFDLAWRLAAHADPLARGLPMRPWAGQADFEWAAFEVMSAGFSRSPKFGLVAAVEVRAMTGSACGVRATRAWSTAAYRRYAGLMGFNPRGRKPILLKDPRELVRLRFAAALLPGERLTFRGIVVPPALRAFDRRLLKARIRREPPCPYEYRHACRDCPVGYAAEPGCDRACHPLTWRRGWCPACSADAWFDPLGPADRCEACGRAAARRAPS